MQRKGIGYYDFRYFQSNHGHAHVSLYIQKFNNEFGYFLFTLSKLSNVKLILKQLKQVIDSNDSVVIDGDQEAYMTVCKDNIEFIITLPGYEPFYINTIVFYEILQEYSEFLSKYESCQIPGIIPESKLNTWSCVPNEYIKPEYWELLKKQQQEQKDNEI